jgi:peptidoglycan/LPS O-acetylase OafA/YrhL
LLGSLTQLGLTFADSYAVSDAGFVLILGTQTEVRHTVPIDGYALLACGVRGRGSAVYVEHQVNQLGNVIATNYGKEYAPAAVPDPFEATHNNLDAVRLSLAILVIFSHSFPLSLGYETSEPFFLLTRGQATGGGIAVDLFFALSGFLITKSFLNSASVWTYLGKRVRRIYPGFVTAMLVCGLLIAPHVSARSPHGTAAGRLLDFVWKTAVLREFGNGGAFPHNPMPGPINGSDWSISYEFWCYIGVAGLGCAGLLLRRGLVQAIFWLSLAAKLSLDLTGWRPGDSVLGLIFGYPPFWARLLPMYLSGVVFYLYRGYIPLSRKGAAISVVSLVLSGLLPHAWGIVFPVAGTYLILWIAFNAMIPAQDFGKWGDFSYGTYLYAFPIQQLIVHIGDGPFNPYRLFALACPLSLLAGAASWYAIERPFLFRRRARIALRAPRPLPAANG